MAGLAYLGDLLAGFGGRALGTAIGASVGFSCLAGGVYGTWKTAFAVLARWHARTHGTASRQFQRATRRGSPHNSSLFLQAFVGIVTFYVVLKYFPDA